MIQNNKIEYEKAMAYIEETRKYGSVLGLESIERLMEGLGNPQNELKIIHVAGTNGKGSTSSYLAHILASAGYLVGRFNSPAVFEYREMIQLLYKNASNGEINNEDVIRQESIAENDFVLLLKEIQQVCKEIVDGGFPHPTTFEIETALSFLYMKEKKVDFAIIEVGLGGRLDATNIIRKPICAVITSIGMDHMEFLGNSLEEIAREKAGIVKEHSNMVVIEQDNIVMNVMKETCDHNNAKLFIASKDRVENVVHKTEGIEFLFNHGTTKETYTLPLLGTHQVWNGLLALEVVEVLKKLGYQMSVRAVQQGLMATKWPGRFEILSRKPMLIIDGAHNQHAVIQLVSSLKTYFPGQKYTFIMGVLRDKEYVRMLDLIGPYAKKIITVTPHNPRALDSKALYECIISMENNGTSKNQIEIDGMNIAGNEVDGVNIAENAIDGMRIDSNSVGIVAVDAGTIENGLQIALEEAEEEDIIVGFGSLSYLGKLKEEVKKLF